jgi:hypothetical protein
MAMFVLAGEAVAGSGRFAPITLRVGDELQVEHTNLHCGTFASDGGIGIECFKATPPRSLVPGTYAVGLTPGGAEIFQVGPAHQALDEVLRSQPKTRGKTFPKAKPRQRRLFTVGIHARLILGGTDIICGVGAKRESAVIGCYHADQAFDSIPGTWGMFIEPKTAAILRSSGKGDQIDKIVLRRQP